MQKKNMPNRKSIRLKGWNYRNPGLYFITICTKNRAHYFGKIKDGIMGLSIPGAVAHYYWSEITQQFPSVVVDEYIVMPNHMHGIIRITVSDAMNRVPTEQENVGSPIHRDPEENNSPGGATGKHNPMLYKNHLGKIIRWYKGRATFEIRKRDYSNFAWQSRFYDHIIRNEQSLGRIREYIYNNPMQWHLDEEHPDRVHEQAVEYMVTDE